MWRKGCAFWVKLRFAQWSEAFRLRYFFCLWKKGKKNGGAFIIKSELILRFVNAWLSTIRRWHINYKWSFIVFQNFILRVYGDTPIDLIIQKRQYQNFCHIGGCKNSFSLKMTLPSTFFNIAPQTGKTTSACKFLSNTNKCQDTAFCAGFSLNLGTSTPVAKIRHIFRCKFFKATYAAWLPRR